MLDGARGGAQVAAQVRDRRARHHHPGDPEGDGRVGRDAAAGLRHRHHHAARTTQQDWTG